MEPILHIANKHGIPVVEDACQAHGALYKGRKAGALGALGCFSFYPGKNLGALGEAGAVTTDDKELAARIQVFRDHGQHKKYYHSRVGWNARMDGIQGAVLSIKLKHLDVNNNRRRAHALLYDHLLAGAEGIIAPFAAPHNRHVYHIYAVRVPERDQILQAMAEGGIACAIHYPVPVHLQEAYRFLGCGEGSFPVAERCAQEFLSLPMFPELTGEQIHAVAAALQSCVGGRKPRLGCLQE
jgi:dTDP-4-amino-4,6-dideoxygalactose transaminase